MEVEYRQLENALKTTIQRGEAWNLTMNLFLIALVCAYIALNFAVAEIYSAQDMKQRFIIGQNIVGVFLTNIFYLPAWILQLIEYLYRRNNP